MLPLIDYAQLINPHTSIGMSLYELLNSYPPRTLFDWNIPPSTTVTERLNQEKVREIATRIDEAITKGKELMAKA